MYSFSAPDFSIIVIADLVGIGFALEGLAILPPQFTVQLNRNKAQHFLIVPGMVFVPNNGFTGKDSAAESPVWSGFALIWAGIINLRTSQYLQIYANLALMLHPLNRRKL